MNDCRRRKLIQQLDRRSRSRDLFQTAIDLLSLLCQVDKVGRLRKEIGPTLSVPQIHGQKMKQAQRGPRLAYLVNHMGV